jgi:hypothetical protein
MMISLRDPLADGGDKLQEDARSGSVRRPDDEASRNDVLQQIPSELPAANVPTERCGKYLYPPHDPNVTPDVVDHEERSAGHQDATYLG